MCVWVVCVCVPLHVTTMLSCDRFHVLRTICLQPTLKALEYHAHIHKTTAHTYSHTHTYIHSPGRKLNHVVALRQCNTGSAESSPPIVSLFPPTTRRILALVMAAPLPPSARKQRESARGGRGETEGASKH